MLSEISQPKKDKLLYDITYIWNFKNTASQGNRRRRRQRMGWLNDNTNSMDVSSSKLWEIAKDRELWRAAVHRIAKSQTWHSKWTTTDWNRNVFVRINELTVLFYKQTIGSHWRLPGYHPINLKTGKLKEKNQMLILPFPMSCSWNFKMLFH